MTTSWQAALTAALNRLSDAPRVALLGIGHEMRGDDAAGLRVAEELATAVSSHWLIVPAAHAPENHTGVIRRFAPALVLLIDAADMGAEPGAIRWLALADIDGLSASTHTLPPTTLARYLALTLGCEVALLGIQPAQTALGAEMSVAVATAVAELTDFLRTLKI